MLLLNDHVLKGSGFLPGWVTGKLSDFAGLVVAPLLVVALVSARSFGHRLLCFALVVVPFVGVKVSGGMARAVEQTFGSLGLHWRLWVDPTDLIALAVLPIAWRLADANSAAAVRAAGREMRERLGVLIGAGACLATSVDYRGLETSIFLLNTTHRGLDVQIFRSEEPLACDAEPESSVSAASFTLERCVRVKPLVAIPLDHDYRYLDEGDASPLPSAPRACDAVVVRVAGLPDSVVYFRDLEKREIDTEVDLNSESIHEERGVLLEAVGTRLVLTPSEYAESWAYAGSLLEGPCPTTH